MKALLITFLLKVLLICSSFGQECNQLGVWLWHLERTGFSSHEQLGNNLSQLGIKRVYVKVSDGRVDTSRWDEMVDRSVVKAYKDAGLEVWAWSYNYTENDSLQAQALYYAARTGYDGYAVDVEMEFDGKPLALFNLFFAFQQAKSRAIEDSLISSDFRLYCTTWGNPKDHSYAISIIDPFVDAFMPQTYVEQWGLGFINNITFWVNEGDEEYRSLGATKPIHHIIATQDGHLTSANINEFIVASGPESSVWRVPGGGTEFEIWNDWIGVDWDYCETVFNNDQQLNELSISYYPNPVQDFLNLEATDNQKLNLEIYNNNGSRVYHDQFTHFTSINMTGLSPGIYYLKVKGNAKKESWAKVLKQKT